MKQDFKTLWKTLANAKKNTARHKIQYCFLKAMSAKSATCFDDKVEIAKHLIRRAFPVVTNTNKLANGREPFDVINYYGNTAKHNFHQKTDTGFKWVLYILGVPATEILTEDEIAEFLALDSAIRPVSLRRWYSYFFTRQDIFQEYQLVQTAHAALELGAKLTSDQVKGLHFTCCGVEDKDALENVENVLRSMKINYVVFREPDIGNQKTAIGVYPVIEHKRGILKNYKLLKFNRAPQPVGNEAW